jgi:4-amino-4-deoxy-L-arabinose transferase-like glycosyltransferase
MPTAPPRRPFALALVGALAAIKLAAHVATNVWTPYGFHRDEFLYMAMGRHLTLWRMEFPPAIAMLAELSRGLLGDSLVAVRLGPALAGSALVVLAALLARELGGGRYAQGLAALAVLAVPLFLRAANLFQPVVLDQLWWTLGLYALLRVGRAHFETRQATGAPRWWVALGVAAGLALLTKFTVAFLAVGVLAGVVLTPLRAALATRWPWVALVVALAIGSPSVVGQLRLGFPVAGQMRDLRSAQLERVTAAEFVGGQLLLGPAVLLALAGLLYLLRAEEMRPYRAAGWACVAAFFALLVLHGKPYYLGPVYPLLFGAGGAALEAWTAGRAVRGAGARGTRSAVRTAAVALVVAYGVVTLPLGIPVLAPPATAAYASRLGITAAVRTNQGQQLPLPQDYADMLGWEAQVAAVARAYHALPPDQRARAVVIADNYGEAGAIDFFGPRHGLPPAVCTAGTYWFFGPGDKPGDVVVTLGVERESLARFYGTVTEVGRVANAWGVPEEANVAVHVGEQPRQTLQALWPSFAGQN